jgi:hypothetical protein
MKTGKAEGEDGVRESKIRERAGFGRGRGRYRESRE